MFGYKRCPYSVKLGRGGTGDRGACQVFPTPLVGKIELVVPLGVLIVKAFHMNIMLCWVSLQDVGMSEQEEEGPWALISRLGALFN
jgi:hypothetical protein